jgi:hypothetical protein
MAARTPVSLSHYLKHTLGGCRSKEAGGNPGASLASTIHAGADLNADGPTVTPAKALSR